MLLRYCLARGLQRADAEDVRQIVMLNLAKSLRAEKDAEIAALRAEKDAQIADLTTRLGRLEALLTEPGTDAQRN